MLQNNNLFTSSPLDDISCASLGTTEEFHSSISEILDDQQIIEAEELILNVEYEFNEFTKV